VLVRGFRTSIGVAITSSAGAVWLEDVRVAAATTICNPSSMAGASVTAASRVTFARCTLTGASDSGGFNAPNAAAGLDLSSSDVRLHDCEIQGAPGTSQFGWPAQPGAAGMKVEASTVTIVGCTIRGGAGGVATPSFGGSLCTTAHPPGGPGVRFVGTAGTIRSAESTAVGGVLSLGPMCPGQTGPQGPAISGSGTIVALPGFARHLRANSPVRGGELLSFELQGQPGEVPLLLVALEHEPLALLNGALLVSLPPMEAFVLGALPAGGLETLSVPVPHVGGIEGLVLYSQAAFVDPSATVWLGAGTSVVLLEPGL
jgi:hypothetical protein